MTTAIDPDRLQEALRPPAGPWRQTEVHASLPSTNARAAELARPWSVVVAQHQSAGRGRLDRSWESPPGAGVALSATLPAPHTAPGWLPLLAGLAVADAIEQVALIAAVLKWPNDVLLPGDGDRKVCGVLCEYRPATARHDDLVIVGIGINLHQTREQLPVPTATSLAIVAPDRPVDPVLLISTVLRHVHDRYAAWQAGGQLAGGVRAAYRSRCASIGTQVRLVQTGRPDVLGTVRSVDDDGAIVIDDGTGGPGEQSRGRPYAAGDVVHLRPAAAAPTP